MSDYTFLIPDPDSFVSGGNRYNGELISALRAAGQSIAVAEPGGSGYAGQVWLDSIWLSELPSFSEVPDGLIVHHLGSFYPETANMPAEEELKFLQAFPRFLCTSPFTAERLVQLGIAADQCVVIEPGMHISIPDQRSYPEELSILIVANLVSRKGIFPLLQAFGNQLRQDQKISLTIAGSHKLNLPYAKTCQDVLDSHPFLANHVKMKPDLTPEELREEYLSNSLLVSAAGMETYGMAIREALCFGLPVFCLADSGYSTRHPGIHLTHDRQYQNIDQLVAAVLRLSKDPDRLAAMQADHWLHRPTPIRWVDQANAFIQQTQSWRTSR